MPFRRKARQSAQTPEKQEFQFTSGARNALPKPEPAKARRRKLRPAATTKTIPKKQPTPF